ncbi:ribbon-helix-helix protein, CopG family [Streptomonospora nanhaiensis]|uniref:ribbon-helix-helix protein, CopG family n=1 Tax=Streptomonospora nanhaiensis TaxID=1323731 RepID=UPI001C99F1A2|nr:ribbon-helix-helix protein, CopG family [Streptomonospora nanhaiensis]MBX9389861.1 ribbon-helix-helix protein, CopG family [Streptomonospora nanhaiensis]
MVAPSSCGAWTAALVEAAARRPRTARGAARGGRRAGAATPPPLRETAAREAAREPRGGPPRGDRQGESKDGPTARINVRLPEQLKAAIEEAAAREGRSVNAWLGRAAAASLQRSGHDQRPDLPSGGKRTKQGITGWVR